MEASKIVNPIVNERSRKLLEQRQKRMETGVQDKTQERKGLATSVSTRDVNVLKNVKQIS